MQHVMIDLETLGTTADSVIMSIGAVKFDLESDQMDNDGFYASICISSNLAAKRVISESTLKWWMQQSKEAQAVFHEPKQSLEQALVGFVEWLGHTKRFMWSNGADFDLPMLAHAYDAFGFEVPWAHWNSRCVRTYRGLPGADKIAKPINALAHNALADAVAQAQHVQAIHKYLTEKK